MSVGTTNIKFSDLKTKYNSNGGSIGSSIILSNFRGASFSDGTSVPASGAISINSRFKGKTFASPFSISEHYRSYMTVSSGTGVSSSPYEGHSTNNGVHGSTGTIQYKANGSGTVYVKMKVSSEGNYDFGRVIVNGSTKFVYAGGGYNGYQWGYNSFPVTNGQIIEFRYTKDGSVNTSQDRVWWGIYAA
jgi:hypothetical protein